MADLRALRALAKALGVHTHYTDGLGKRVIVGPETLIRICAAAGAPIARAGDAAGALRALRAAATHDVVPPVLVAWDGNFPPFIIPGDEALNAELCLEDGEVIPLRRSGKQLRSTRALPLGYHRLTIEVRGKQAACTVIAAPTSAWHRLGAFRSWGIGGQLAALRSKRSRSVGDLNDLRKLCEWVRGQGGDTVTLLPLLPTFNSEPPECSPYSPVSRLFWSEIILDLGAAHLPTAVPSMLDVTKADAEVRAALAAHQLPRAAFIDEELARYARFRGAQARLGRNWRAWPTNAQTGTLESDQVDSEEERFHLVAQTLVRHQIHELKERLELDGFRLGLDLAVGVHPDGYDPWSRRALFGEGMSVGAPPDGGFPSGQDWGFSPVLPDASRREGHRYLAASIAHQAGTAGVLRVDHIMAWTRLYWIPHGFGLHEGSYVSYPAEELFAVLTLESHRNRCEVVGENLGTVPPEIDTALPRHRISGMYLAQFEASKVSGVAAPTQTEMTLVGTHDTPTFAGWLIGNDIEERVRYGLLTPAAAPAALLERSQAARRLAKRLGLSEAEPGAYFAELLAWLGRSASPLVVAWLEDLWLEECAVNLPGTPSSQRPNWQRPMSRLLDDIMIDPMVTGCLRRLQEARAAAPMPTDPSPT